MVTSSSFSPSSNVQPTNSPTYYYTPGSKWVNRLSDTVFGKLQRRPVPLGLNVTSQYVKEPNLSKKLTGKPPVTVGLYNKKRLQRAGYHGTYVVWPVPQEGEQLEL